MLKVKSRGVLGEIEPAPREVGLLAQLYLPTTERPSTPRNTGGKTLISSSDKFCTLHPSLNQ